MKSAVKIMKRCFYLLFGFLLMLNVTRGDSGGLNPVELLNKSVQSEKATQTFNAVLKDSVAFPNGNVVIYQRNNSDGTIDVRTESTVTNMGLRATVTKIGDKSSVWYISGDSAIKMPGAIPTTMMMASNEQLDLKECSINFTEEAFQNDLCYKITLLSKKNNSSSIRYIRKSDFITVRVKRLDGKDIISDSFFENVNINPPLDRDLFAISNFKQFTPQSNDDYRKALVANAAKLYTSGHLTQGVLQAQPAKISKFIRLTILIGLIVPGVMLAFFLYRKANK